MLLLVVMVAVVGNCNSPPPSIDNGSVTVLLVNNSLVATYSCVNNHVVEGGQHLVCNSKGNWSGIIPKCGMLVELMLTSLSFHGSIYCIFLCFMCSNSSIDQPYTVVVTQSHA